MAKQTPRYFFEWAVNHQLYEHLQIDWDLAYQVSWFDFEQKACNFVIDSSYILEKSLFLVLQSEQHQHLLWLTDCLVEVRGGVICVKMATSIKQGQIVRDCFTTSELKQLKAAQQKLKKLRSHQLLGWLADDILQARQLALAIQFWQFAKTINISVVWDEKQA